MDYFKFIDIVRQFPQVWDRNCAGFKDRDHKRATWDRIGEALNHPAMLCKNTFKSLREKYVREREKQSMFKEKYVPWQHLDNLAFLDPHIVLRKQSVSLEDTSPPKVDEPKNNSNGALLLQLADINSHNDFDKTLIDLVRKAGPIWNRKSNGYPSKQLKYQLWKTIGQSLNKDINVCMTRWKGLREKYIRQRGKYQEGEPKWEFLDEMSFLDDVIQYRRKLSDLDVSYQHKNFHISSTTTTPADYYPNMYENDDNSMNDSSNDFIVKSEHNMDSVHENSYDSTSTPNNNYRKRTAEVDSPASCSPEKKERPDRPVELSTLPPLPKSPEQMFGDLIAVMLAKKSDRDKNIAMIEIMQILTK